MTSTKTINVDLTIWALTHYCERRSLTAHMNKWITQVHFRALGYFSLGVDVLPLPQFLSRPCWYTASDIWSARETNLCVIPPPHILSTRPRAAWWISSVVIFPLFAPLAEPQLLVPLPQLSIKNNSLYFSADASGIQSEGWDTLDIPAALNRTLCVEEHQVQPGQITG